MKTIAGYADGIGPWKPMIVTEPGTPGKPVFTAMVKEAHAAGLKVHPYTFRQDEGQIPPYAKDFTDLLNIFLYQADVDGVFSDFPTRRWRSSRPTANNKRRATRERKRGQVPRFYGGRPAKA